MAIDALNSIGESEYFRWRGRPGCLAAACLLVVLAGCSRSPGSTAVAGAAGLSGQQPSTSITLSIIGTNDLHGAVLPEDDRGGLALFGGYVNNLRAERARDGGAVLVVDAGDMWHGTMESNLTEGAVVVEAYGALGYAAATIGNHEFDFGPVGPSATPQRQDDDPRGALKARAADAAFPFLAANLIDEATGRPIAWPNVQPSVLLDVAGVKVGLIGVTSMESLNATIAANTGGLRLAPLAHVIQAEALALRAKGAALIVVVAHAGGQCQTFSGSADLTSCDGSAEIFAVARALPAGLVDVIVAGHTHDGIAHEVAGVAIIEAFARGQFFGRVDVTIDRASGRASRRRLFPPEHICAFRDPATDRCVPASGTDARAAAEYAGDVVTPDPDVEAILRVAAETTEALKNTPLGVVADTPIPIGGAVESPLGNLFTDALLAAVPDAEVAVNNTSGGLRAELPAGAVTYGALFRVFPFDNRLAQLSLTGAELRRVFAGQLQGSSRLLGVAGLRVVPACTGRELRVTLVRPSGAEVGDAERLRIATTDFLAMGAVFRPVAPAGGFEIPVGAPIVRDLVAEALSRLSHPLRASDLVDTAQPRWPAPSKLPFRCGVAPLSESAGS